MVVLQLEKGKMMWSVRVQALSLCSWSEYRCASAFIYGVPFECVLLKCFLPKVPFYAQVLWNLIVWYRDPILMKTKSKSFSVGQKAPQEGPSRGKVRMNAD